MPLLDYIPDYNMPKGAIKRPSAVTSRRTQPYTIPSSTPGPTSHAMDRMDRHHSQGSTGESHPSGPWSSSSDEQLMRARQQGLNWANIAATYFPSKTPNACRKRHERLMEKRNVIGSWDEARMGEVAKVYGNVREKMWKMVAEQVNEKWNVVESKDDSE
ncbi:MAG: hypothetical protein Q9220_001391 [cf. Caloplaca sp. 1 TL-2023]